MSVHFLEENRKETSLKRAATKKWLLEVIRLEGFKPGVITYVFGSDEFLLGINNQFLKRDYYTDVISFDYTKDGIISGDIIISVDRVAENAIKMGFVYPEELKRIMVHGLLHLIGYDDFTKDLKASMSGREDFYLAMSGEVSK